MAGERFERPARLLAWPTPAPTRARRPPATSSRVGGDARRSPLALLPFRDDITPLSKGFGFLVVVVVAALRSAGSGPGIVASFLGFVTFNFFFLPPYGTFASGGAEYVVVLFVFLGLSVLISALLARRATARRPPRRGRPSCGRCSGAERRPGGRACPGREAYAHMLERLRRAVRVRRRRRCSSRTPDYGGLHEDVTVGAEPGELPPQLGPAQPRAARPNGSRSRSAVGRSG